jgi:hypothetical protein
MKKSKCPQTKCVFNQLGVGCRKCKVCGCEPYMVNDNCDKCWNCSKDMGVLRWDMDNEDKVEEKNANKNEEEKEEKIKLTPYIN